VSTSRAVFITALVALTSLGVSAAEPKSSRPQVSSNGRFSVRAVEPSAGQCRLEVSQESELLWELPRCFGTADDLYFVSNDGERVWVMRTLPEMPAPKKRIRTTDLLARVPVAYLVDRAGQVVQARNLGSFMDMMSRRKTQVLAHHFKWLEGVSGAPGRWPRSNPKNQVEFETLAGKTVRLEF
jgi:hypothetical protein